MKSAIRFLEKVLVRPDLELYLAFLAVAVCAPSLWLGLQVDDLVHRAAILGVEEFPEVQRSPLEMFSFVSGDPAENFHAVDAGLWPWWSATDLRLNLWRPLTGATHGLDYLLWPDSPFMMHVHSLAWLALGVVVATRLYRRLLPNPVLAGLAALLFAFDDVHGWAAAWLANRNAIIAAVFAMLALIAYDRWRRDGWGPGAVWTPGLMLLGLLSNEGAVATGAYLLAYALFLDRGSLRRRMMALAPAATTGVVWWLIYRLKGYGAAGSGVYIDPGRSPLDFAAAMVDRMPSLLRGLLAWPPAEINLLFVGSMQPVVWWLSLGLAALFAAGVWALLRFTNTARFFALGMVLSLVPACATFPANRLLLMASIGGLALVAQLLIECWRIARDSSRWRWPARGAVVFLVLVHVVIAPLSIWGAVANIRAIGSIVEHAADSLPSDEQVSEQQLVIVNTPTVFVSSFGPVIQAQKGVRGPARSLVLGSSVFSMTVERLDESTLSLRPRTGYLAPVGTPPPGVPAPKASPAYMFQMLDHLFRDIKRDPFEVGDRLELTDLTIEIRAVEDGRPMDVRFRFAQPLEDPSLRWVRWDNGIYVPFELPTVGESVVLRSRIVLPDA